MITIGCIPDCALSVQRQTYGIHRAQLVAIWTHAHHNCFNYNLYFIVLLDLCGALLSVV